MKKSLATIAALAVLSISNSALAEGSANVGFMSKYIFRGFTLGDSSAMGGADWEGDNGFYAGTWFASVDPGMEIDGYLGYARDFGPVSFSVGGTYYYYTDLFDDDYKEINLSVGYKLFTFEAAYGRYDNSGDAQNYQFVSAVFDHKGFFGTIGTWLGDFDGSYLQFGYGREVAGIDLSLYAVHSSKELVAGTSPETNLVFEVSKSFGFGKAAD